MHPNRSKMPILNVITFSVLRKQKGLVHPCRIRRLAVNRTVLFIVITGLASINNQQGKNTF